ncbi:MAG: carbohydrate-binding family 9-like protein [Gemmatimonadota bacterium]
MSTQVTRTGALGTGVLALSLALWDPARGAGEEWPFPCDPDGIERYTAYRIEAPLAIDGHLAEPAWQAAPRSPRFEDLISGRVPIHDTRAAVLWDHQYLYIGVWLQEPDVQADLAERDAPIYNNNDAEVFIAGQDAYYEFEINALGTIYEVFFVWDEAYDRGGYAREPSLRKDHPQARPFSGVGLTTHPRGLRTGFWGYDLPGLEWAVQVDGTLNDSRDRDRGWTVELAFPWEGLKWVAAADGRSLPPRDGDVWRVDFSRFNQYKEAPPAVDSGGWAWSSHGVWDSHVPECFPFIRFSTDLRRGEEQPTAAP